MASRTVAKKRNVAKRSRGKESRKSTPSRDREARKAIACPPHTKDHAALDKWRGQEESPATIAARRGIKIPQDLDQVIGSGSDLWKNDRELDDFLADIYRRRRAERN